MLSSYIEVQGARPSNFFRPQTLTSGSFAAPRATRMLSISSKIPIQGAIELCLRMNVTALFGYFIYTQSNPIAKVH